MPKVIDETKIFSTALDLLVSHGYGGATTQKIAHLAGINEVTLFRRYGSKAGLFERVIEHEFSDTRLNQLAYTGDIQADLCGIVEAYVETNAAHGSIIPLLLVELPRNPELQGALVTPLNNIQRLIGIIQQYQQDGHLKNEPPLACLAALIGPILASQMFRHANLNLSVPAVEPQTYVESFLLGRKIQK